MKRLPILLALLLLITQSALAGPIGPIPTEKRAGKLSVGTGYIMSSSDWEARNEGPTRLELQQNQLYAELGLGIGGSWEIILRGGIADMSVKNPFIFDRANNDGDDSFRAFGSMRIKGALFRGPYLTVGSFIQGTYHPTYDDRAPGTAIDNNVLVDGFETIHLDDRWDAQAGFIAQNVLEGAILYGGPFYNVGQAKFRRTFNGVLLEETKMKEKGTFGALLGIRWPLTQQLSFDLEGQLRSASHVGAALHYRF